MDVLELLRGFLTTTWTVSLILTILLTFSDPAFIWIPTAAHLLTTPCIFLRTLVVCLVIWIKLTMSSAKKCCVPNCNKTRDDDTILHLFPNPMKHLDRFKLWMNAIGGEILFLDNQTIFQCRRVCHLHYEPQYYTRSKRLSPAAVATLNLQDDSLPSTLSFALVLGLPSRQVLRDISNQATTSNDPEQNFMPSTPLSGHLHPSPPEELSRPSTSQEPSMSSKTKPEISTTKENGQNKRLKKCNPEIIALGKKIKKMQNAKDSVAARLKKALKLSENPSFQRALKKFTTLAVIFTLLQFREVGKKLTGRRFRKNEKVMALALYKQGPRAYRWLRKIFVLPSPLTLSRMISRASLKPGINKNLFLQLKKKAHKMSNTERMCVLLFDEVAIKPHFDYNRRKDNITGFVNNGRDVKNQIADHALVFMIRGIQKNYKQPIAYTFCAGSTPKIVLALQIKEIIKNLYAIGFHVIATVCDQGATNVSAVNYLINQTREQYIKANKELKNNIFEIDGHEVIPLYDPPHLIKGIRNNLLVKNMKATINGEVKTAKWEHVLKLYKENAAYKGLRLMPKLTENHVDPKKIFKMKVKCATQVFSYSVAAHMGYLANLGALPKEAQDTADIIIFFDKLFDSQNGSYENWKKRSGKPFLGPVTPHSDHRSLWQEAKKVLGSMKFIHENNTKSGTVPSLTNCLHTIENTEYMVEKLSEKYGLTSLWMRHFNQDPLENFFGCIRSHGYRNVSPTCHIIINNMSSMRSKGSNCEVDTCTVFKSLNKMFFKKPEMSGHTVEIDFDDVIGDYIVEIELKMGNPKIKAQLEYVTGYVLRKLKVKDCKVCKECFYGSNEESVIFIKQYHKNKRLLTYPSRALVKCFSQMQDVVINVIRKKCIKLYIRHYVKTVFSVVLDYHFIKCDTHKSEVIDNLENLAIKIFLYNWFKDTNKILSGNRSDFDEDDPLQKLAYNYYKKRNKRIN